MNLSSALLGFIRAIAYVVVAAIVSYLANAANLHGLLNDATATIVAGLFAALDHYIEAQGAGALFGAVK